MNKKDEIAKLAIESHEKYNNKSTICLTTGLGKTYLVLKRFRDSNIKNKKLLFFGSKEIYTTNALIECEKLGIDISSIDFCCVKSLKYYYKFYTHIVFDECHLESLGGYIFLKNIIKLHPSVDIICLTGTPKTRSKDFNKLLEICPISYTYLNKDAINSKLINNIKIIPILVDLSKNMTIHVKVKQYDFYTSEEKSYKNLINKYNDSLSIGNTSFPKELSLLKNFFKKSKSKIRHTNSLIEKIKFAHKGKILVYAGSIENCQYYKYPAYHSKNKSVRDKHYENFLSGKSDVLINVDGIKESVSIDDLKFAIITSVDASESSFGQIVGRLQRLIPDKEIGTLYVIIFKGTIEEKWFEKATKNYQHLLN